MTRRLAPWLLIIVLHIAGCGSNQVDTYPVSGTIRFEDGEPVPFGVIEFREQSSGISARSRVDSEGRFALGTFSNNDGAPAGNYRVIVVQHFTAPLQEDRSPKHGEQVAHDHSSGRTIRVADEFADFATSGLQAEVLPGAENTFEFVVRRESPM